MKIKTVSAIKESAVVVGNIVVAFAIVLILYTNFSYWYDSFQKSVVISPLVFQAFIACAMLYAILAPLRFVSYLKTRFAIWCLFVLFMLIANIIRMKYTHAAISDMDTAISSMQLFILAPAIGYLVYSIPKSYFKAPLVIMLIIAPCILIYDFINPGLLHPYGEQTNSASSARISGLWRNPNIAAEAVVLLLLLVRNHVRPSFLVFLFAIAGIAVFLTVSRSGIVAYLLIFLYLFMSRRLPVWSAAIPIVFVVFLQSFFVFFEDIATEYGRDGGLEDVAQRIDFLSGEGESEEDFSTESRKDVVIYALAASWENPFFGNGVRYSDPVHNVGPHNMVVDWLYQYGIVGVLLWLSLVYILYKSTDDKWYLKGAVFAFIWFSFFSHNILESNYWFIFFSVCVYHNSLSDQRVDKKVRIEKSGNSKRSRRRRRKKISIRF